MGLRFENPRVKMVFDIVVAFLGGFCVWVVIQVGLQRGASFPPRENGQVVREVHFLRAPGPHGPAL